MKIKTIVADDHQLFRRGVANVLSQDPQIELLAEAGDGTHLLQLLQTLHPHIILLDLRMPQMDGLEAAQIIKKQYPRIGLVVLSMSNDAADIRATWQVGIGGYLLKEVSPKELVNAVKMVHGGGRYYSVGVAATIDGLLNPAVAHGGKTNEDTTIFSEKDKQIIQLLANGFTLKAAATAVHLASKTVEHRIERMKEKTETKNIAHLVAYALLHGLITGCPLNKRE